MTREDVLERVSYDPERGTFYRLERSGRGGCRGGLVPTQINHAGYPVLSVACRKFLAHRLAWLVMTGEDRDPSLPLDHINGDRSDFRWNNIRAATPALNTQNRGIGKNNTSGVLGVCWDKQSSRWKARVNRDGKQNVVMSDCFGRAVRARREMEKVYFEPGFCGSRRPAYAGELR